MSTEPSDPGNADVDGARTSKTIYNRPIEHSNLLIAETVLRELGRVSLVGALVAVGGNGHDAAYSALFLDMADRAF